MLSEVQRGQKLLIDEGEKTHLIIKQIQNFLVRHRVKIEGADRTIHITVHSMRHSFAAEEYKARLAAGMNEHQAKLEVSKLLGHNREDVTDIYTCSVDPDDIDDDEEEDEHDE